VRSKLIMMYRCLPAILASFVFLTEGRLTYGSQAVHSSVRGVTGWKSRLPNTCENPSSYPGFVKVTIKTPEITEPTENTFDISRKSDGARFFGSYQYSFLPNTEVEFCVSLPEDCYIFTITDERRDGLCCDDGVGYYIVELNGVTLQYGGEFGGVDIFDFCVVGAPSVSPSISVEPSLTQLPSLSLVPSLSSEPSLSSAPSLSDAPSLSGAPSISDAPSSSEMPSLSFVPSLSVAPSVTDLPSVSGMPTGAPTLCSEGLFTVKIIALGSAVNETQYVLNVMMPDSTDVNVLTGFVNNGVFEESKCLDPGHYTFTITDTDGLCCDGKIGEYEIFLDGELQGQGSEFSTSETVTFTYTGPTASPTISNAPTSSNMPSISSLPSVKPSSSLLPSNIPSNIPSIQCVDSPLGASGLQQGCSDIGQNPDFCNIRRVSSHCPLTCSSCPTYRCSDSVATFEYRNRNGKCSDIPENLKERSCTDLDIRQTCRETCGNCN